MALLFAALVVLALLQAASHGHRALDELEDEHRDS